MQALPFIGQYEIISKKYEKDIASGGLEAFAALDKKEKELKKYFDFVSQNFERCDIEKYFVLLQKETTTFLDTIPDYRQPKTINDFICSVSSYYPDMPFKFTDLALKQCTTT